MNRLPLADAGTFRWGCSSAGRAPALQAGGQRFDPAQLHQMVLVFECEGWLFAGRQAVAGRPARWRSPSGVSVDTLFWKKKGLQKIDDLLPVLLKL